jgi:deoxyribodipyrimidine photo-lyase
MIEEFLSNPRVTVRRAGPPDPGGACVVYWMQRAQRAVDNPALDVAIGLANALKTPAVAFFGLHPFAPRANHRHYQFLVEGLDDVAQGLQRRRVGFVLRRHPDHDIVSFADQVRAAIVIGDENPLRQAEARREVVADRVRVPFWTVDADVVVPARLLEKEQYAARTIRPRLHARLLEFLGPARDTVARAVWRGPRELHSLVPSADSLLRDFPIDRSVSPVAAFRGGTSEARRHLRAFVRAGLRSYAEARNQPELDGTSRLSPYLHFGHIGPREVALAVREAGAPAETAGAFLEQLIVRRELAVNFVLFNPRYDRLEGCEKWARQTLARHRRDRRAHLYTEAQLESADTHDPLWNAAQIQMMTTGWMHGYVRMYWAKKLLEWTRSAEEAFELAVRLNDRYQLDGRDPNGYANIAWAIGGKHDRPWPGRPIFGTVRSMSLASTSRKFDAQMYIRKFSRAAGGAGAGARP